MLTLVEVTNPRGDTLQLPLLDISAGYSVRDIEGLNPVAATLTSASFGQSDGVQFQNARRDSRNITMKLGLEPDYVTNTVQSLRSALYSYFLTKATVQLGFYIDDVLYVTTSGQVESCDNSMFSADPEVDISILCYDPDFYGPAEETISGSTVSNTDTTIISYEGTTETGLILTLNVDRDLTSFSVYNTAPDNSAQIFSVTGPFVDGDVLVLNTVPGSRSFTLSRDGETSSAAFYADETSDWATLQNGDNNFRVYAPGAAIGYTVAYTPKYGAI